MDSKGEYFAIFVAVPLIIAIILGVIVGLVGWCVIKPDKMVRIMFPYIRKNGNNTVMFGFILGKWHIRGLFWGVCWIIFQVILTFFANILIFYVDNNNPFSATSIEEKCFYNGSIAELTPIERLELNESIICYAINYNIVGAMGQATGALAMGWVIASVFTWIALNVNYKIIKSCESESETNTKKLNCYKPFLLIIVVIFSLTNFIVRIVIIGLYYHAQWLLYLFRPENGTILVIIEAVAHTLNTDIKKEPKSLEEHCRKTVKEIRDNQRTQSILKEMAKYECRRMIAYEAAVEINDEEKMKNIVQTAYNNIMEYNEDREIDAGAEIEYNPQDIPLQHM